MVRDAVVRDAVAMPAAISSRGGYIIDGNSRVSRATVSFCTNIRRARLDYDSCCALTRQLCASCCGGSWVNRTIRKSARLGEGYVIGQ